MVFFGLIEDYARLLALFVTLESRASVILPDDWSEMGPRCVTGVKLLFSTVLWRLPARLYKNHKSFDSHSYQVTNQSTADEELVRAVMSIGELAVSTPWWGSATSLRLTAHVSFV